MSSATDPTTATSASADPVLLKEVLQQVENSPFGRNIGGIDSLCFKGSQASFFPEDQRPALRKKWDDLRRLKIKNYYKFLLRIEVTPGAATIKELVHSEDTAPSEDALLNDFGRLSLNRRPPPSATGSSSSAFESPSPSVQKSSQLSTPPRSVTLKGSTSTFPSPQHPFSPNMDLQVLEGTQANPFKFDVNRQYPEKNIARFTFTYVPTYNHKGWQGSVWELEMDVPHMDFNKWEVRVSGPNGILIKGPSKSYWEKTAILWNEQCHDYKDKDKHPFPSDEATQKAHQAAELAIDGNPNREFNWWLAEIPPKEGESEVQLDNTILSGPGVHLSRAVRKVKSPEYPDLKGAVLTWKIAEGGGVQTEKQKEVSEAKDLMSM